MQYTKESGNVSYSTLVFKNLRWNGSICAFKNGEFANLYIGNGSKLDSILFDTKSLPELDKDSIEQTEQFEPNPEKEPVIEVPKNEDMDGSMNNMDGEGDGEDEN